MREIRLRQLDVYRVQLSLTRPLFTRYILTQQSKHFNLGLRLVVGTRSAAKKITPRGGNDGLWNPPQPLKEHRREIILRSVAKFLRSVPLSSVTMEDIATELGMTKGNLYYYFKDKQDILYECHMRSVDISLAVLKNALSASESPREKLRILLVSHILGILNDGFGGVMQTDLENFLPEQRSQYVKKRDQFERGVRMLIEDGIRAGEFKELNVKLAGFSILGAINWMPKWYRPSGSLSPTQIAEQMSDYFLGGLSQAAKSGANR